MLTSTSASPSWRSRPAALAALTIAILVAISTVWAIPLAPRTAPWVSPTPKARAVVPDGPVYCTAVATNGCTYVGGKFTSVGLNTGGGARLDPATGSLTDHSPAVNGNVRAAVPDGGGGYYIGGDFSLVGAVARSNIAHILADGSVDSTFAPEANLPVSALALRGTTRYAGGQFSGIGGQTRGFIAALDAAPGSTGAATPWDPAADDAVSALAVIGSTVYVGGRFGSIGGQPRSYIAALNADPASIGTATPWDPGADGEVSAIATGDATVYAGGYFSSIGGQSRYYIAALDASPGSTGAATSWDPDANGRVGAIATTGTTVYVGGAFSNIGGQTRHNLAALDAGSPGAASAWAPEPDNSIEAIAVSGSTVYAGGSFSWIGGVRRDRMAALDGSSGSTGTPAPWDPRPDYTVNAIAVSGPTVYAGGAFQSVAAESRNNAYRLLPDGSVDPLFDPSPDQEVHALAVCGDRVYLGGAFSTIGGRARNFIAEVDGSEGSTGTATEWDPNAEGNWVMALAVSGSTVYAGGFFTAIGGQARNYIAALDASPGSTGEATAWNPEADGFVVSLCATGSNVYAGGYFDSIGRQPRGKIAALDAATGDATQWDPQADSSVEELALSGSTVYAGGYFSSIGGQIRHYIAALDASPGSTGTATSWDPQANGWIGAIATSGTTVYVGGGFSNIGGQDRACMAALDASPGSTGLATPWVADASGNVQCLAVSRSALFAGGDFGQISGTRHPYFAAFDFDTSPPTDPTVSSPSHGTGAWSADPTVDIAISADATDTQSGVDGYSVSWSRGATATPDRIKDLEEAATALTSAALSDGICYFNLRTVDNMGNWTATRHLGPFRIDSISPAGSVVVDGGAALTYSLAATLDVSIADTGSGPADMRLSTDGGAGYGLWLPFDDDPSVTLPAGDGTKSVSVQVKDGAGNVSTFSDSIRYRRPSATLTRPVVTPAGPYRSRYFTVTGFLKPLHTGTTKVIFYRKIRGRWRQYRSAAARNSLYSPTTTKYRLRYRVPYPGDWYVKSYHGDARHYPTYSSPRVFRVR
jgi:trimeric autotransporter adhesin